MKLVKSSAGTLRLERFQNGSNRMTYRTGLNWGLNLEADGLLCTAAPVLVNLPHGLFFFFFTEFPGCCKMSHLGNGTTFALLHFFFFFFLRLVHMEL